MEKTSAPQNWFRQGLHQTLVHRGKQLAHDNEPIGGLVLVRPAEMNDTRLRGLSVWLDSCNKSQRIKNKNIQLNTQSYCQSLSSVSQSQLRQNHLAERWPCLT